MLCGHGHGCGGVLGALEPGADAEPWAGGAFMPPGVGEGSSQDQFPSSPKLDLYLRSGLTWERWRPVSHGPGPRAQGRGVMAPGPKCVRSAMSILSDAPFM